MVRWDLFLGISVLLLGSQAAQATVSFTGTFSYDTDLQYFTFTLAAPTPGVALRTWSYAGGTNGAGASIASGGFEPYLNIYAPDGTQMNPGASGPCTVPPTGNALSDLLPDPTTGGCSDVYYPTSASFPGGVWLPGTYTVVLSTAANPGIGNLSDGFFASQVLGLSVPSNFTCQVGSPGYQGNPPTIPVDQPFCDQLAPGIERDGHWAIDFIGVDSATEVVPEPGSMSLGVLGCVLVAARTRYRRHRA